MTRVPEESAHSVNCIILQFQLGLNRQFSRKYPTSYLLCSHKIFPLKAIVFRIHLSTRSDCMPMCAHISQNKWKTPIDITWSSYDWQEIFTIFFVVVCYFILCFDTLSMLVYCFRSSFYRWSEKYSILNFNHSNLELNALQFRFFFFACSAVNWNSMFFVISQFPFNEFKHV